MRSSSAEMDVSVVHKVADGINIRVHLGILKDARLRMGCEVARSRMGGGS